MVREERAGCLKDGGEVAREDFGEVARMFFCCLAMNGSLVMITDSSLTKKCPTLI